MIDKSGVAYRLTPMGTIIEKAYETLECDCERVYSSLKFDIRKGKANRLKTKIASVEDHLERSVKH